MCCAHASSKTVDYFYINSRGQRIGLSLWLVGYIYIYITKMELCLFHGLGWAGTISHPDRSILPFFLFFCLAAVVKLFCCCWEGWESLMNNVNELLTTKLFCFFVLTWCQIGKRCWASNSCRQFVFCRYDFHYSRRPHYHLRHYWICRLEVREFVSFIFRY